MKMPFYPAASDRQYRLPLDIRCTRCDGLGLVLEEQPISPSCFTCNPCMQCACTGLTTICSGEVINARRTD